MKYKVIVNPASGKGRGRQSVPFIEAALHDVGLTFDLVCTERPLHAVALAQQAAEDGYDVVVAAGGDGTVNEVLNGLMAAKQSGADGTAMGVLCVGRGNDFAYGAGVPQTVAEGCQLLAGGKSHRIDVGHVRGGDYPEGRYFANGVGIGFDAVVGFEAAKFKHLRGFLSYLVAAVKTVYLYSKAPLLEIAYDDQLLTQPSLLVSIMNGRRMGGSFMMAPHSQLSDGLFDLCIAKQVSQAGIFALIPHVMRGTQEGQPSITTGRARRVVVTAVEGSLPAHADGETICVAGKQLTMELVASQISLIGLPGEGA